MKFNSVPWFVILLMMSISFLARRQLVEEQQLAFFCEAGGQSLACQTHWLLGKVFYESNAVGYFALLLGGLSVIARSGLVGYWASVIGIIGLVLNNGESAAAGFLLGVLALARAQFEQYRTEDGTRQ